MNIVNLKRYALIYVITIFGLFAALELLRRFAGFDMNSSATTIIPAMVAAMVEGQKRAQSGQEQFTSKEAWTAAGWMALVAVVLSLLQGALALLDPAVAEAMRSIPIALWLVLIVIFGLIFFVMNRVFLTMGYKNQRKYLDKQEKK